MTAKDIALGISADPTGLQAALNDAQASVKAAVGNMQSSFGSLEGALSKAGVAMAAFTTLLAGGAAFKEAVASSVSLNVESEKLGRQLGISATQASVLKMALGNAFVSQDQFTNAANKITGTLNSNEAAFTKLGVATRDSNGNFRSTVDIMQDVNARLLKFKEGTDRNVEGVKIYGKAWADVAPVLAVTAKAQAEAQARAEELGLVVGVESVAATNAYRGALNDVGDVMDGVKNAIGQALMPALTAMGNWFASIGPQAVQATRVAMIGLITAFEGVRLVVSAVYEFVKAAIQQMVVLFLTLADVASHALQFDFSGAKAAWSAGAEQMRDIGAQAFDNIVKDAEDARDRVSDAMTSAFSKQTPTKQNPASSTSSGGAGDSRAAMAAAREAAKAAKDKFDAEIESLKGQEAAARNNYDIKIALAEKEAQRIGEFYGMESKAYAAAQNHILDLKRAASDQLQQISQLQAQSATNAALADVDVRQSAAQLEVDLGRSTKAELLEQERAFEEERYAIREQALEKQLQLAARSNDDPVKVAQLQAQLEDLERGHQRRLQAIRSKATLEGSKEWRSATNQMEGGFASAMASMIKGQKTFADGMRAMAGSVLDAVVTMITEIAAQWLAQQLAQLVLGKTTSASIIVAKAAEAGAGGVASMAAAPFPMNLTAPAFGAAMHTAAMFFQAEVAAARGYDVPAGVMPITQLHPREMVLPAELADVVRGAAGSGARAGGLTMFVNAVDPGSFRKVARHNARGLTKEAERFARKNFRKLR